MSLEMRCCPKCEELVTVCDHMVVLPSGDTPPGAQESPRAVEYVRWLDSVTCNYGDWGDPDDFSDTLKPESLTHASVGFVVAENDVSLLLAQSRDENGSERWAGVLAIPKAAILDRQMLAPV